MPTPPALVSYRIELEIPLAAPIARVWKALVKETTHWWPAHFYSQEGAKRFVIENKVGGRIFEDWGGGAGAEWGRVVVYQPPQWLAWSGNHFTPSGQNFGRFFLNLKLRGEKNKTVLSLTDTAFGLISDQTGPNTESGWRELFGEHFKHYVEKAGKAKGKKK